ncbi:MAG: hypothetical protein KGI30_11370, partial [Planctomycetota bacterium]|nr:hypothetical protein [Planctomycetota bacterium]
IYKVKGHIEAVSLSVSNVIGISYRSKNPDYAKILLSTLMDQYVTYRAQIYNPSEEEVFFADQSRNFEKSLSAKEGEMIVLLNETKSANPQREIDSNLLIKNDLERLQQQLKNEAIEKKLYIEHLEKVINSENIEFFSFIENNMPLNNIGLSLQRVYGNWLDALKNYRPGVANVRGLKKEVGKISQTLKTEVETYKGNQVNQYRIMLKKIANIEGEIEKIIERNIKLQVQVLTSQKLSGEIEFLRLSRDTFTRRKEEARMNRDLNPATRYIRILSKAFLSSGPVFPQPVKVIPMGILIGFILGCSAAFLKEYFDHTFKKPRDVEIYAGVPVLFSIPFDKKDRA